MGTWLQTDEQRDVVLSLIEAQNHLDRIFKGEVQSWKWAIIAMACAVNGALICNLSGGLQVGALCQRHAREIISAANEGDVAREPARRRLASPGTLLKRATEEELRLERAGPTIRITEKQCRAFKRLLSFRNSFMHFEPLGWHIECSGFPIIFEEVLAIVDQVAADGWSFRHLGELEAGLLNQTRTDLRELLDEIKRGCADA